jgi:hypothetical protein
MKRFIQSLSLVSGLLAMLLIGDPAVAGRTFDNDDLKGDYLCNVVEVRRALLPTGLFALAHCVIAGTGKFDGVGMVTLNATQRCSIAGTTETTVIAGTQYYSVNPDGSFLISESSSMTDPAHGQIVEHGRSLLLDGTTRTLAEILSWSGMCMRR